MQLLPEIFQQLTNSLRTLPGVGPRSAQRMALYLLEADKREKARDMAKTIQQAIEEIRHCKKCRIYTDQEICAVCENQSRDQRLLCVVETPSDLIAIESSGSYKGRYFVLMGKLSPLDGIGPQELGIDLLISLLNATQPEEVILALSSTVEGEATSHYLSDKLSSTGCTISRIAQGIPTGGNLEYLDTRTLNHALSDRKRVLPQSANSL